MRFLLTSIKYYILNYYLVILVQYHVQSLKIIFNSHQDELIWDLIPFYSNIMLQKQFGNFFSINTKKNYQNNQQIQKNQNQSILKLHTQFQTIESELGYKLNSYLQEPKTYLTAEDIIHDFDTLVKKWLLNPQLTSQKYYNNWNFIQDFAIYWQTKNIQLITNKSQPQNFDTVEDQLRFDSMSIKTQRKKIYDVSIAQLTHILFDHENASEYDKSNQHHQIMNAINAFAAIGNKIIDPKESIIDYDTLFYKQYCIRYQKFQFQSKKSLEYYENQFKIFLIEYFKLKYEVTVIEWIQNSILEYCKMAMEIFEKEIKIAKILYPPNIEIVQDSLFKIFILNHYEEICTDKINGVMASLQSKQFSNLSIIYNFIKQGNTQQSNFFNKPRILISKIFGDHVIQNISKISEKRFPTQVDLIEEIAEYSQTFDDIMINHFLNDQIIATQLAQYFSQALMKAYISSFDLASYFNSLLETTITNSSSEIMEKIKRAFSIIRRINMKEVFLQETKIFLALRLLNGANVDLESYFLSQLEDLWGMSDVQDMRHMIADIRQSQEMTLKWKSSTQNPQSVPYELNVNVLKASIWPSHLFITTKIGPLNKFFHQSIQGIISGFKKFYCSIYDQRALEFDAVNGICILIGNRFDKAYEFQVNIIQMQILLLFNHYWSNSLQEIKVLLDTDTEKLKQDIIANLRHLLFDINILSIKNQNNNTLHEQNSFITLSDKDKIEINNKFSSMNVKIYCNLQNLNQKDKFQIQNSEYDSAKYDFRIDSCIMRLMKLKGQMYRIEIQNEVCKQLDLDITILHSRLRKRIESLIEREYIIKKSPENPSIYEYIP